MHKAITENSLDAAERKVEETLTLWSNALATFSDNREQAKADLRAAIRDLRREAYEQGKEAAAGVVEESAGTLADTDALVSAVRALVMQ